MCFFLALPTLLLLALSCRHDLNALSLLVRHFLVVEFLKTVTGENGLRFNASGSLADGVGQQRELLQFLALVEDVLEAGALLDGVS